MRLANDTREMTLFLLWCQEQGWLSYPAGHFALYQNVAAVRDSMRLLRDAPALIDRCVALGLCKRPGNYQPPVPHSYCAESEEGEHTWNTFGRCNHCGRATSRASLRKNKFEPDQAELGSNEAAA